jgi:putative FmdB family regulatory protein
VPLYEYACSGCGEDFTLLQSMNAAADEAACPECGGDQVAKQFSTFAPSMGGSSSAPPMPPCGMAGGGCGSGCGM